jgi:hypothetical protein
MLRDFKNDIPPSGVQFYVGVYQENSIARGNNTLYVIGEPDIEEVIRRLTQYNGEDEITHIFFGAEHSFKVSTFEEMESWTETIQHFLTLEYWCTLDVDVSLVNFIHETDLSSWNKFIPMLSVKIPYSRDLGYNAVVKIDDVEFNHSNYGIWTHALHDLMSFDKFTSWDAYNEDVIVMETIDDENDT